MEIPFFYVESVPKVDQSPLTPPQTEDFPEEAWPFPPTLDQAVPVHGGHQVGLQHEHGPPLNSYN